MAAAVAQYYYFRFRIWWCHSLPKVKIYLQTKFRRHILIHDRNTTTSGLEKQTSAILEFFFRLLLRPYFSNRSASPHQDTNFCPNRATRGGIMTSYTTSRWRQRWLNTTSGFVFDDVTLIRRSKSIRIPNFVNISQFTAEI